jgi:GT2 family glycosyltransferase
MEKMNFYKLQKGLKYLKHYGIKDFIIKLEERQSADPEAYERWYEEHRVSEIDLKKQREQKFSENLKISIVVPIYQTPEKYLREMIESVVGQSYSNWELCIADGSIKDTGISKVIKEYQEREPRIKYQKLNENLGIAQNTNKAIQMASGEFVGFLDHDDVLSLNALYETAKAIEEHENIELLYSDEDKMSSDSKHHFSPHFKPDFNLDLLRSNNYICHFLVVKRDIVKQEKGFLEEFDGAQDYDFIFRCVEKAQNIYHISKILYHWRVHEDSTSDNPHSKLYAFEAGKKAIEAHLQRSEDVGIVIPTKDLGFYRVQYKVPDEPFISIVIINSKENTLLFSNIEEMKKRTKYKRFQIIVVQEIDEGLKQNEKKCRQEVADIVYWDKEYNYGSMANLGANHGKGDFFLFLRGDVKGWTEQWLEELISQGCRANVGAVGCKSMLPNKTVKQAGLLLDKNKVALELFHGLKKNYTGYLHKAGIGQQLSIISGDCMLVKSSLFHQINGFETHLKQKFYDVDFCLKLRKLGYFIVYTPYTEILREKADEQLSYNKDIELMKKWWKDELKEDSFYNCNLSSNQWEIKG